jgi:hypothetical protein
MLIKCPDCNHDVSSAAASCPNCGHPIAATSPSGKTTETPEKIKSTSISVKKSSGWGGCLGIGAAIILVLIVIGALSENSSSTGQNPTPDAAQKGSDTPDASAAPAAVQLEVKSWRCYSEYNYMITEGQVTNITDAPLKNVEAVANYYDSAGGFVTSGDAIIAYNPVLPGQTSPFKAMATGNPAIKKCDIAFKDLLGGSIGSKIDEQKKAK